MELIIQEHSRPLRTAFTISRGAKTEAKTVTVVLLEDGFGGCGECVPYARYGESCASVVGQLEHVRAQIEAGISRLQAQSLLPAGAARCALDCAIWDLEANRTGRPVWAMANLPAPVPVETAVTITLAAPDAMAAQAKAVAGRLLKLKLGGKDDIERLGAVHAARPDARLIVDGNEGMSANSFAEFAAQAGALGVVLIEQPFPAEADDILSTVTSPVAICADESAHTSANINALSAKYDAVNIKLDKSGGLTEALAMYKAARAADMQVMVGCMVAGSLSMAPAVLLAQHADIVDLDGPLWLAEDVPHGLYYDQGFVSPPQPDLWGGPGAK